MPALIELNKVSKIFGGTNVALDNLTFSIPENFPHIITIAGESGSGKTTIMMLLLGFYEPSLGNVLFNGKDIWKLSKEETMEFRRNVQAVFQDPFAVYNPFYKVDNLLSIPIKNFKIASKKEEARELMYSALRRVGLRPEETLGRFPHQLSGGQRQRIAVARALILQPKVLIADEPVSMVDASLRAVILRQLKDLNDDLKIPILYITHDLTTAYHASEFIIVLYRGSVMEAGGVEEVIRNPQHPYTQLLVNSIPWPDPTTLWGEAVEAAKGIGARENKGCKFATRCPHVMDRCLEAIPPLFKIDQLHAASCYLFDSKGTLDNPDIGAMFTSVETKAVS
jgi:oligopeptide/dipeptide ABC transporter ATP-binding protein